VSERRRALLKELGKVGSLCYHDERSSSSPRRATRFMPGRRPRTARTWSWSAIALIQGMIGAKEVSAGATDGMHTWDDAFLVKDKPADD